MGKTYGLWNFNAKSGDCKSCEKWGALLALQDNKQGNIYLCKSCINGLFNNQKSAFDSSSDEESDN